jgi:hypothetical protein
MKSFIGNPSTARFHLPAYLGGTLLLVCVLVGIRPPAASAATDIASSMPAWQKAIAKLQVPGRGCFNQMAEATPSRLQDSLVRTTRHRRRLP